MARVTEKATWRRPISLLMLVMLGLVLPLGMPRLASGQAGIFAEALDWAYVRSGPGIAYPRVGTISKGTSYAVLGRTEDATWLEIAFPAFAGGRVWVFRDVVTVSGSLAEVPVVQPSADSPTLTPTLPRVVTSAPPWSVTPIAPLRDHLGELSSAIYDYLVSQRFQPGTEKLGSVFVMDLRTGERYSINPGIAYSAMSLIKLPILVAVYRKIAAIPTLDQAQAMALMIVCSENLSANQLLSFLGDGDEYAGADYVTQTMRALGLRDTFLVGPLFTGLPESGPTATVPPLSPGLSSADQSITDPDPFNQTTPDDLGWLLAGIYQCALDGTGPLLTAFPGALTAQKCRGILRVLRADDVPAMLWAGVPDGTVVAHKHGWTSEVHGDAGIVFTPGGDYVLVVMLRNKTWLSYRDSFPTIAEISRMVYNSFNPADNLEQTHTEQVPMCSLGSIDPQVFADLRSGELPPVR